MQFGTGRAITLKTGAALDREASAPSVSEVNVSKLMDQASPKLFAESCYGKAKPKIEIHLCKTDAGKLETYMEYTLSDVLLSGYNVSSAGDRPTESISFNFTKIEMKFVPWGKDHAKGSPIPAGYDLGLAKKV
jgi:type VI secretion system secreted protein Hcp